MTQQHELILPPAVEEDLIRQAQEITLEASEVIFKDASGQVSISGILSGVFALIEAQAKRQAIISLVRASQEARQPTDQTTGVSQ